MPYFVDLADAFNHGRLDLADTNPASYDVISSQEHVYVAQQPLPAMLLMPAVVLNGVNKTSDILFDMLFGILNAALCGIVLELIVPDLDLWKRDLLVVFFALGTVMIWLSNLGTIWFIGQVVAAFFVWVFIHAVWRRQIVAAGVMLGFVLLSRPSIVPGALLFAAGFWILKIRQGYFRVRSCLKIVLWFLIPISIAAGCLGFYNAARFGNALDFGYQYLNDAGNIRQRRLTYGTFNPVFFPGNLVVAMIRPPTITLNWNDHLMLKIEPDAWGMGILWTCPLLLMAGIVFLNPSPDSSEKPENVLLALTISVVMLPSLLYHNTGSAQFGYRFILDALPFWMILLARAARKIPLSILAPLTGYCIVVNLIGYYWIANLIEPILNR